MEHYIDFTNQLDGRSVHIPTANLNRSYNEYDSLPKKDMSKSSAYNSIINNKVRISSASSDKDTYGAYFQRRPSRSKENSFEFSPDEKSTNLSLCEFSENPMALRKLEIFLSSSNKKSSKGGSKENGPTLSSKIRLRNSLNAIEDTHKYKHKTSFESLNADDSKTNPLLPV